MANGNQSLAAEPSFHSQPPQSGGPVVTNTAGDGSYTITAYHYGRLASVTRYDSLNSQLSSINYSYDPHGRQNTSTDARNGTTTFGYNNADLVSSVTTPNPGTLGGTPQTTLHITTPCSRRPTRSSCRGKLGT
ncbi:MAG: RHS repeat domain-containing protein [Limisphaerales bacterium]